jgi:putative methionine-R-sulfoxide reductase with GAF domain
VEGLFYEQRNWVSFVFVFVFLCKDSRIPPGGAADETILITEGRVGLVRPRALKISFLWPFLTLTPEKQPLQRRVAAMACVQVAAGTEQERELGRYYFPSPISDPSPLSSLGSHHCPGFYTLDPQDTPKPQLILGPFQGKVACQTIAFGRGVCGAAAASRETQLVPDVEKFPGHIACDGDSKSEIVVPIVAKKGTGTKLVAIIDIDCAEVDGFDEVDKKYLEQLAAIIGEGCDW